MKCQTKLEFSVHIPIKWSKLSPMHHFSCKLVFCFLSFELWDPENDEDGLRFLFQNSSISLLLSPERDWLWMLEKLLHLLEICHEVEDYLSNNHPHNMDPKKEVYLISTTLCTIWQFHFYTAAAQCSSI